MCKENILPKVKTRPSLRFQNCPRGTGALVPSWPPFSVWDVLGTQPGQLCHCIVEECRVWPWPSEDILAEVLAVIFNREHIEATMILPIALFFLWNIGNIVEDYTGNGTGHLDSCFISIPLFWYAAYTNSKGDWYCITLFINTESIIRVKILTQTCPGKWLWNFNNQNKGTMMSWVPGRWITYFYSYRNSHFVYWDFSFNWNT